MSQLGEVMYGEYFMGGRGGSPVYNCSLQTDYYFKTDLEGSKLILDGSNSLGQYNKYMTFVNSSISMHQNTNLEGNLQVVDITSSGAIYSNSLNSPTISTTDLTTNNLTVNNQPIFNNGLKIQNSALQITDANNNIIWNFRPDGKLGIGVSSAEMIGPYWLWVKNGIMTERLKVAVKNTLDWKDYVFDKSYKLRKLEDVEAYIHQNKHLPEIPSADEVVRDGIDVQTMDAKLLQKIEELTLYVIELKKEINQLKKRKQ